MCCFPSHRQLRIESGVTQHSLGDGGPYSQSQRRPSDQMVQTEAKARPSHVHKSHRAQVKTWGADLHSGESVRQACPALCDPMDCSLGRQPALRGDCQASVSSSL